MTSLDVGIEDEARSTTIRAAVYTFMRLSITPKVQAIFVNLRIGTFLRLHHTAALGTAPHSLREALSP
jgi:hypothetical protein